MGGKRDVLLAAQNALSEFSLKILGFVLTIFGFALTIRGFALTILGLVLTIFGFVSSTLTSAYSQRAERTG